MTSSADMDRLTAIASHLRIPLYGMIELTWRCNFRCVHCYQEGLRDRHQELNADEWKQVFDEVAELGCAFLTFTGGEPLVRKDFPEIYRAAVVRGFITTVFTNASLVTEEILALWTEHPPRKVEISIYGMNPETYAAVTERAEGFDRMVTTVDRLKELGIKVELKAPAMKPLMADLPTMRRFAHERGIPFRCDPGLFPRLDGNQAPLKYRLSPKETVALEAEIAGSMEDLRGCFAEVPDLGDRVYHCGAASNAFNVNPSGYFEACAISRTTSISWREVGAAAAWGALGDEADRVHRFAEQKALRLPGEGAKLESCGSCSARAGCSRCPGKSWLESGDVERPVDHHCEITQLKLAPVGAAHE